MKNFIWISGSINSGKSTVAKLLSLEIASSVNIELDALSHFAPEIDINQKALFIIQDALDLAKNWSERNYLPILNWPLWGNEAEFMMNYSAKLLLKPALINLTPGIHILKQNRGERPLTGWELNRIDYMHEIQINEPRYGVRLDNSELSPAETAKEVLKLLRDEFKMEI